MPESDQPTPAPFSRPSARPSTSAMPIQRGNYGIPTRQISPVQPAVVPAPLPNPQPAPAGPRMMDVAAPRPFQPTPIAQAPVVAPQAPQQPATQQQPQQAFAAPAQAAPAPQPSFVPNPGLAGHPSQPIFAAAKPTTASKKSAKSSKLAFILPKARIVLIIIGALIVIGGGARWATAGSIANDTIAVGAVSANDGSKITIQFTANDGQLHKLYLKSKQPTLIPGSAVQIAYQSGAPDKTAKEVSLVKSAHNLGVSLFFTGVVLLVAAGVLSFILKRKDKDDHPVIEHATPVTV